MSRARSPPREADAISADDFDATANKPGSLLGTAKDKVQAVAYHLKDSALPFAGEMFASGFACRIGRQRA